MWTPQAHCRTQQCENFREWFPETNFVFNFVDHGKLLSTDQLWTGLGIHVATIRIVMCNMLSNCVKVFTSIDKAICTCYRQKCTLTFYLDYVCQIGLTLHGQVVCFVFFSQLSWLLLAPIVVDLIR